MRDGRHALSDDMSSRMRRRNPWTNRHEHSAARARTRPRGDRGNHRRDVMSIEVKILLNEQGKPAGKLADAEIHFNGGELAGLKLLGFSFWGRRDGPGHSM